MNANRKLHLPLPDSRRLRSLHVNVALNLGRHREDHRQDLALDRLVQGARQSMDRINTK
jgi:hypothetical protein